MALFKIKTVACESVYLLWRSWSLSMFPSLQHVSSTRVATYHLRPALCSQALDILSSGRVLYAKYHRAGSDETVLRETVSEEIDMLSCMPESPIEAEGWVVASVDSCQHAVECRCMFRSTCGEHLLF